jgi:hypothetical protein
MAANNNVVLPPAEDVHHRDLDSIYIRDWPVRFADLFSRLQPHEQDAFPFVAIGLQLPAYQNRKGRTTPSMQKQMLS